MTRYSTSTKLMFMAIDMQRSGVEPPCGGKHILDGLTDAQLDQVAMFIVSFDPAHVARALTGDDHASVH
jgi:hypothetical protein